MHRGHHITIILIYVQHNSLNQGQGEIVIIPLSSFSIYLVIDLSLVFLLAPPPGPWEWGGGGGEVLHQKIFRGAQAEAQHPLEFLMNTI